MQSSRERWAARARSLAEQRRQGGLLRALAFALYRAADRRVALRVYRIRVLELERLSPRADPALGAEFRFLAPEEVARFARDPANDLAPRFAERVASGRHLCFAALLDGKLASYTWYAIGEVDPSDSGGVPLRLPSDCVYAYKAYTRPELRGRHLQGRLKQPVVEALLARGIRRRVAQIEWINRASLRTSDRSGYRDVGWLLTLGSGPRPRFLASPGLRRLGFAPGRRAPAPLDTLP